MKRVQSSANLLHLEVMSVLSRRAPIVLVHISTIELDISPNISPVAGPLQTLDQLDGVRTYSCRLGHAASMSCHEAGALECAVAHDPANTSDETAPIWVAILGMA